MIPPISQWRDMKSAPRNGECILVVHREYNRKEGRLRIATAQWLCNELGEEWGWRLPFRTGTTQYADGWLTVAELMAFQQSETRANAPEFDL